MTNASKKHTCTVLGIETSCDETAAAVVRLHAESRGEILSSIVYSQVAEHAEFGGVVPEIAARAHILRLDRLIAQSLREAGLSWAGLDGVAATAGPGLMGGLLVGLMSAKAIALAHGLPFIAVNHLQAHALTPLLTDARITMPYLLLLISGGHSQMLAVRDIDSFRRYGTTIDDALGEAFDKVAKMLGLGYPGGPRVEKLAQGGDPARFAFPRPMRGRAQCHFSFAGLKTAVRKAILDLGHLREQDKADICASFQQAVADVLAERLACACRRFREDFPEMDAPWLVAAGGVAANAAIRQVLRETAEEEGFRLCVPPADLCTDNAAMVAFTGAMKLARGLEDTLNTPARARWPLDPDAEPAPFAGVKG